MNADNSILVTGASGRTGRRVVDALARRNMAVRAFVRRDAAGDELRSLGAAEIALGDLFDEAALADAIRGCAQVMHICPPMHPREAELARTVTDLCRNNGVGRLILYSVLHPLLTAVAHHRRKLEAEQYLVQSGQPYTILQPARYMQHLTAIWDRVVASGIHDMPFSTTARFNVVDLGDLAAAAAIVAGEANHAGATYQLAGPEALDQRDMAHIISEVIGQPVEARAKPPDEFRAAAAAAGMAAERIEAMVAMNRHYDAHGLVGNAKVLGWLLGREPTDFSTFVARDLAGARPI